MGASYEKTTPVRAAGPRETLDAIRDLVAAAEEQGWDTEPSLRGILDRGRDAYAALLAVMDETEAEPA